MADEVRGVAVLDDRPGVAPVLFIVCCADGKPPLIVRINVRDHMAPATRDPEWIYRAEGDVMHVSPSVHVQENDWDEAARDFTGPLRTRFHNGASWTIPFVKWSAHCARIAAADLEDPRGGRWELCREINSALFGS